MSEKIEINEEDRLAFLKSLRILNTPLEERFERIARLVRRVLGVPVCGISFLDKEREWFKSIQGSEIYEVPRDTSFCNYAILENKPLIVPDAAGDKRFERNPFVVNEPFFKFYAGAPIIVSSNIRIGAVSVLDSGPRNVDEDDLQFLQDSAESISSQLKARLFREIYE